MVAREGLVRADDSADARTLKIRALNDQLRIHGRGGMVLVTRGLIGRGKHGVLAAYKAIAEFDAFNADNDPHGEHDCAFVEVGGQRILFKIDYYDRDRRFASPDPADPKLTVRVMTVMLAEEY
jgi:hypothetical protein